LNLKLDEVDGWVRSRDAAEEKPEVQEGGRVVGAPEHSRATLEQGRIVRLRHKVWAVTDVIRTKEPENGVLHKVTLECLSDDGLGRVVDVIWEREVAPTILEATSLPTVRRLDPPRRFQAFIDAVRWSSASLAEGDVLQAPFRGGVQIEEYQLVPVTRAVAMPRVNLLIADDVGLGKTIEAGLIAQELIHTHRTTRILVLCPAHLKGKWLDEMQDKFGLEFRSIDRDSVLRMRREFGPTVNPWASFPRLVTSIDYLKTEHPRRLFEELLDKRLHEKGIKPWDLLILDEAHNVAPSGRKEYVRDSERTTLLRAIASHFEHKLFLTATPHNGYRESFTGLLELLDDLRFSRGVELDREQLAAVTIRRLKEDIRLPDGRPRFPPRVILPKSPELHPDLYVDLSPQEQEVFDLLHRYTQSLLQGLDKKAERPTQFVLTLLKKRALSSPMALRESLVTHTETAGIREELGVGDTLFRTLEEQEDEDWSDDEEKEEHLEATTEAASRLLRSLSDEEKSWLQRMFELADDLRKRPDSKARALIRWIERNLQAGGKWNGERVLIFTEYRHTLEYLKDILSQSGFGEAVLSISGGMPDDEREEINAAFQSPVDQHPVRILIATDAASEGADFQNQCRNVIHYEIPWNPVRLEQRNGRIDRHGQTADEVRIHHFVFRNHEDSEFLKRIVEKVEAIRTDLGSVGALIAENVRQHALGKHVDIASIENDARRKLARQDIQLRTDGSEEIGAMVRGLNLARANLGITMDRQLNALRQALELEGKSAELAPDADGRFLLTELPASWSECRKFLTDPTHQRQLTFVREAAPTGDSVSVLHLDHPLMRRALAALRSQMWKVGSFPGQGLHRVTAERSSKVTRPTLIGWARLMLLGPERNFLHEGLVAAGGEIIAGELSPLAAGAVELLLNGERAAVDAIPSVLEKQVTAALPKLEQLLRVCAAEKAEDLGELLTARGAAAEKHARNLATERMVEIRRSIKQWEKEAAEKSQLKLFDDDEKNQREHDLKVLRTRLGELEQERETEPKRQRLLFKVVDRRTYPIALQILVPEGAR
jgi:ERCC4-related helicase